MGKLVFAPSTDRHQHDYPYANGTEHGTIWQCSCVKFFECRSLGDPREPEQKGWHEIDRDVVRRILTNAKAWSKISEFFPYVRD